MFLVELYESTKARIDFIAGFWLAIILFVVFGVVDSLAILILFICTPLGLILSVFVDRWLK